MESNIILKPLTIAALSVVIALFCQCPLLIADDMPLKKDWSQVENIDSGIKSNFWGDRMNAVSGILKVANLDTIWAINKIITAFDYELEHPSSLDRSADSYGTNSERVQRHYMNALLGLCPGANYLLRERISTLSGETMGWVLVVLGLQKDETAHAGLRDILMSQTSPNLKAMAVRSIRTFSDTLDIPYLLSALSDTHHVEIRSDWTIPGRPSKEVIYPVGMEVASSLRKMGYEAKPDPINGGYKVEKIK
jgi:HEAT repeat protein